MRHKVFSYKVTFWIPRLISNWKFARNKPFFFFKQNKNNGQLSEIRGDVFTQHQIRSLEPRPLGVLLVLTLWTQKLNWLKKAQNAHMHGDRQLLELWRVFPEDSAAPVTRLSLRTRGIQGRAVGDTWPLLPGCGKVLRAMRACPAFFKWQEGRNGTPVSLNTNRSEDFFII